MPRWLLRYPTGHEVLEPPAEASIMTAPRGASELVVVQDDGQTVVAIVPLHGALPIFYRRRSVSARTFYGPAALDVLPPGEGPKTDALVFGSAREDDHQMTATLSALLWGKVVKCPDKYIDWSMIQAQLGLVGV